MKNAARFAPLMLSVLASFGVLAADATKQSLGEPHESEVLKSTELMRRNDDFTLPQLAKIAKLYDDKCPKLGKTTCLLTECEAFPAAECRADRVLLWRGEPGLYDTPSVAAMARSHRGGSVLSEGGDAKSVLAEMYVAIDRYRQVSFTPDELSPSLFRRADKGYEWNALPQDFKEDPNWRDTFPGDLKTRKEKFWLKESTAELLLLMHVQFSYPYFDDPVQGPLNMDPLVSYSADPGVGIAFSDPEEKPHGGRVIVLSVPAQEIVTGCQGTLPEAGMIWDPRKCPNVGQYTEERELDAVLYPKADYVFKSFVVEKDASKKIGDLLRD